MTDISGTYNKVDLLLVFFFKQGRNLLFSKPSGRGSQIKQGLIIHVTGQEEVAEINEW